MTYRPLIRFLLPLAITRVIVELGEQVLNGGMARAPAATETLATFGLAWGLVSFLVSPTLQNRQLSLVLADSAGNRRVVRRFVLLAGLLLASLLVALALSPLGVWVLEGLHGVERPLGVAVRQVLLWLAPLPILAGLSLYYSGLLLRVHRTEVTSYAIAANVVTSFLVVVALLANDWVRREPTRLPVLALYAGLLAELAVILWGYRRYAAAPSAQPAGPLSLGTVARFFWPLALIMAIQGLSRPAINLFIAREAGAAEALAVLTVVYSLGRLPYGWLNEIRNLAPAFHGRPEQRSLIGRFSFVCGLLSFALMLLLFWTPLRGFILMDLVGISPALAPRFVAPLAVISFYPMAVMLRAYLHGIGLAGRQTGSMALSAPARLAAIITAMLLLPYLGVHGATRGIAALLAGFVFETLALWWGVRGPYSAVSTRYSPLTEPE